MKKILAITFGSLTAFSMSAAMATTDDFIEHTGIYVAATYTKPSNNGLSIGDTQVIFPVGQFDPFNRALFLEPDFEWDYMVGLSYHVPHTHTRVFIDYDNYTDDDGRSANGVRDLGYGPSKLGGDPEFAFTTAESASVQERVREGRLGLRHFLHFGPRFFVDFSGFIEFVRASRGINEFISQPNVAEVAAAGTRFRATSNSYHGWGPGVGMKMIGVPYAPCPNFSIFAGAATTLFYGSNSFNVYEMDEDSLVYQYNPEDSKSVVSQVDVDLGIDYRRLLHINNTKVRAGITLGVRYTNLINVFKNGNTYYNPTVTSPGFVVNSTLFAANLGYPNDWGRVGPYLQFRLGGAHA